MRHIVNILGSFFLHCFLLFISTVSMDNIGDNIQIEGNADGKAPDVNKLARMGNGPILYEERGCACATWPNTLSCEHYNEENVYLLCKKLCTSGVADDEGADLFVVFITNEKKQVPLWHQKASQRADGVVLWDYHVICIQRRKEGHSSPLVWDLDSTLPFPTPLPTYVKETFQPSFLLFSEFQRFFRAVHAPLFLRSFASDRRHMKDSIGNWISEPPAYEAIVAEDGTVHNLNEYLEISVAEAVEDVGANSLNAVYAQKLGILVGENHLEEAFSLISP